MIVSVCFSFTEICLHWTLWENGTGAQLSPVAHLHRSKRWDYRALSSSRPHATLHPSKWVFSQLDTHPPGCPSSSERWTLALCWAQAKPEFNHANVEYSRNLNIQRSVIQMSEGSRETALSSFLLGSRSCKRPRLEGSCVPRQILAAGWGPGTQGGAWDR